MCDTSVSEKCIYCPIAHKNEQKIQVKSYVKKTSLKLSFKYCNISSLATVNWPHIPCIQNALKYLYTSLSDQIDNKAKSQI